MSITLYIILLIAVITDLRSHRIPNLITLGGVVVAMVIHSIQSGLDGLTTSILGVLAGFFLFLPFYLLKGMAAGDVKLMAAIGAYVGPQSAAYVAASTLMAGLVLALLYAFFTKGGGALVSRYGLMIKHFIFTGSIDYIPPSKGDAGTLRFPYAVALLAGTVGGVWWSVGSPLG